MTVRTRFAPSPTGLLHIGGVRTALFSWLYARHHGGQFILRVEDTDRERSTNESVNIILEGMQWLGLDHDEGPHFQTQRFDRYKAIIEQLLAEDKAYYCYCSKETLETMRNAAMQRGEKPKYAGTCRHRRGAVPDNISPVVRFKNPEGDEVVVEDLIQGRVVYSNLELDDLIIARSDGTPTYNLTVVVDDMDMKISHVIRGDDHLNNTPRQINILKALGARIPEYAHVPMILGQDGKKISKRDTDTVSVLEYRDQGILPEALLNYLIRLGWSHGDQEIFSVSEMIELFDIAHVNKAAAALNPEKLLWLNQHYIKEGKVSELVPVVAGMMQDLGIATNKGPDIAELVAVQKERCKTVKEIAEQSRCFYEDISEFEPTAAKKHLRPVIGDVIRIIKDKLLGLHDWSNEAIQAVIETTAEENGLKMGKVAQPLRVSVTGTGVSPSIDDTIRLVGKERTIKRLELAITFIENRASA